MQFNILSRYSAKTFVVDYTEVKCTLIRAIVEVSASDLHLSSMLSQ